MTVRRTKAHKTARGPNLQTDGRQETPGSHDLTFLIEGEKSQASIPSLSLIPDIQHLC